MGIVIEVTLSVFSGYVFQLRLPGTIVWVIHGWWLGWVWVMSARDGEAGGKTMVSSRRCAIFQTLNLQIPG